MSSLPSRLHSTEVSSPCPTGQPLSVLSAAQLLLEVARWPGLKEAERRELTSAINTAVRVAGVPADLLPIAPERLRTDLLDKSAAAWGVSPPARANILSRLRKILRRLDVIDTAPAALSDEWAALLTQADARTRMSLSCFMKYCTARSVSPNAVTDQQLESFEAWLITRTLNANPRSMVTALRRAWNKAVTQIPGWPKIELHLPSRRGQLLLPFEAFPASFNQDLDAYTAKLAGQNIAAQFELDDDYLDDEETDAAPKDNAVHALPEDVFGSSAKMTLKPLRPLTIVSKRQLIKVAANALHRSGTPLAAITSLASLVSPLPQAKAILEHLYQAADGKPTPQLGQVGETLRQIAKYHARCPEKDVAQLSRWTKRAQVPYKEMTAKNRRLVEEVLTPARHQALLNLPTALLQDAACLGASRRGAVYCKHAAMIGLLTRCPMRLGNLIGLRIDRHMLRPDPKTPRMTALLINEDETKNQVPLTFPLNVETADLLQIWLREYRPLLAPPGNPYVFPGKGQGPMTRPGIRDAIRAATHERLGVAINPHAFRHIAAEAFLQQRPGDYENARRLLGHKRLETTTRAYCRTENKAAIAIYDEILERSAATLGMTGKRARRAASKPGGRSSKSDSNPRRKAR